MKTCIWKWLGVIVFIFLFAGLNQDLISSELSSSELKSQDSRGVKKKIESGIDLSVVAGTSVVDLQGESFGAKAMPLVGVSLFPWIQIVHSLYLGAEVSMQYTFRSDYSNFYYYDAFGTFGFIPNLHLLLQGSSIRFLFLIGVGLGHSFSEHLNISYPVGCIGAGIRFKSGFISSILLTYNHSFVESFQSFESVRLSANIRLLNNSEE